MSSLPTISTLNADTLIWPVITDAEIDRARPVRTGAPSGAWRDPLSARRRGSILLHSLISHRANSPTEYRRRTADQEHLPSNVHGRKGTAAHQSGQCGQGGPIITLATLINLSSLEYFFVVGGIAASLSREMI
jgi:hypothetical protein